MSLRKTIFGRNKKPSIKLGGMAATIPTKSDLFTWFYFNPTNIISDIKAFQIIGSDVYFEPVTTCQGVLTFLGSALTSLVDSKGVYFGHPSGNQIFRNTAITDFYSPTATYAHSSFRDTLSLVNFYQPAQTSLGGNYMYNSPNVVGTVNFPLVTTIQYFEFRNCGASVFLLPLLTSITNAAGSNWRDCVNAILIEMKKIKIIGTDATVNQNNFLNIKTGCEIRVHIDCATNNAGGADADLVYAKSTRACVVKFYDNSGNYVSTL